VRLVNVMCVVVSSCREWISRGWHLPCACCVVSCSVVASVHGTVVELEGCKVAVCTQAVGTRTDYYYT
jgi:hypothetical protein